MKGGKTKTVWIVDGAYLFKSAASHGRFDYLQLKIELQKEVKRCFRKLLLQFAGLFHQPSAGGLQQMAAQRRAERAADDNQVSQTAHHASALPVVRRIVRARDANGRRHRHCGHDCKLTFQNRLDTLVLCAGDGDFEAALEHVREAGREIAVAAFRETCSTNLQHLRQPRHLARGSLGENQKRFAHARRRFRVFRAGRPRFATGDENLL